MTRRGPTLLTLAFLLGALTLAVYWPSLDYDFVDFDDYVYVTQNEALAQGLGGDLGWVLQPVGGTWAPLTWLSFAVDYELGGLEPRSYHRTNVVLHALGVVFVYLAFVVLTRDLWRSAFVAAVFGLHPVHVESVAWVAERKDVLSGLLLALCLGSYADYVRYPFQLRKYLPVVVFLGLGLMAKSTLVTVPLVLLLLDHWPLDRFGDPATRRRLWLEKLPLVALCAVAAWLTLDAGLERTLVGDFAHLPLLERSANAALSVARYVGLSLWPAGLAVLYPHPGYGVPFGAAALAAAAIAAATVVAIRQRDRWPWLAVGWGWFLVTLLPVLGFVHVGNQALADRFLYLPQTGLAIALAWSIPDRLAATRAGRIGLAAAAAALVAAMIAVTSAQLPVWRDTISLFGHAVAVTDDNAIAHQTLGQALVRAGRERDAAEHFEAAARIEPRWGKPQLAQGRALEALGDAAQARRFYALALEARPGWPPAALALARGQLEAGAAAAALRTLDEMDPPQDAEQTVDALALRGLASARVGRLDAGEASLRRALEIAPERGALRAQWGMLLAAQGRTDAAQRELAQAHAAGDGSVESRRVAARLAFDAGDEAAGLAELRAALAVAPDDVAVLNDLAWRLLTADDVALRSAEQALPLARRAATVSRRREPEVLDTLATALFANGRPAHAARVLDEAIVLARAAGASDRVRTLRAKRDRIAREAAGAGAPAGVPR